MRTTPKHKIPYLTNQDKAADIAPQTRLVATFLEDKITDGTLRGPRGIPGTNAVPADEAVAGYLGAEGSATNKMLASLLAPTTYEFEFSNPSFTHYYAGTPIRMHVQAGICHFMGAFKMTEPGYIDSNSQKVVGTLPPECRPSSDYFALNQGSGENNWYMQVVTNGDVRVARYGPGESSSNTWLPFSASWPVGPIL